MTEVSGDLGSDQGEEIWVVGMGREHVRRENISKLLKERIRRVPTRGDQIEARPMETQESLARGQDNRQAVAWTSAGSGERH